MHHHPHARAGGGGRAGGTPGGDGQEEGSAVVLVLVKEASECRYSRQPTAHTGDQHGYGPAEARNRQVDRG